MIEIKRIKSGWGFTLVEILVSTTILLIVFGLIYTIFSGTLSYWQRGYSTSHGQQQARLVFSRMTEDISSLFLSIPRQIYCFGTENKFYFVSALAKGSESDLSEVGYELNPLDNTLFFSYQAEADYNFDTFDKKMVMATGVIALKFSYLDRAGEWLTDWDSRQGAGQQGSVPEAIKISFEIDNEYLAAKREVFETVVELPISTKY